MIFSVSSAGLGLLVVLASSYEVFSLWTIISFTITAILYIGNIIVIKKIFDENKKEIEYVIKGLDKTNSILPCLDKLANFLFIASLVSTILLSVMYNYTKYNDHNAEVKMNKKVTTTKSNTRSLAGLGKATSPNSSSSTSSQNSSSTNKQTNGNSGKK